MALTDLCTSAEIPPFKVVTELAGAVEHMNLLPADRIPSFVQLQERLMPLLPPKSPDKDIQTVGITNPRTPPKQGRKLAKAIALSKHLFIESPSKVASSSK